MSDNQRIYPIDYVVLHHSVGPEFKDSGKDEIRKWFSDIGRNRGYAGLAHSYHYYPQDSKYKGQETFTQAHFALHEYTLDGNKYGWRLTPLMDDVWNNVAWHAGNWPVNQRSIGIETCGRFDQGRTLPEKACMLIADYFREQDKKIGGKLQITAHKQFSATACPGSIIDRRQLIIDMINNPDKYNKMLWPAPIPVPEIPPLPPVEEPKPEPLPEPKPTVPQSFIGLFLQDFANRLSSRKFLIALLFALIVVLNAKYQFGLTEGQITSLALGISAYIFGEAYVDSKKN